MPVHGFTSSKKPRHKCIGFSQALEEQRARREEKIGPQPWVGMKFAVGLVMALVSYTFYVYVARFCNPMIQKAPKALGGRTLGIVFLAVFSVLFLMFGWSYTKVVLTPPGFAEDYTARTPPPVPRAASQPPPPGPWESEESFRASPYHATTPPSRTYSRPSIDIPSFANNPSPSRSPSHSHSRRTTHESTVNMSQTRPMPSRRSASTEATPRVPLPAMVSTLGAASSSHRVKPPPSEHVPHVGAGSNLVLPLFSRHPPTHPVLSPEYRYCHREGFVKPARAHHCRACGTCILKYDHHCPWIGQCVGAFNHKFFVNFLQWSAVFTVFVFASLIALVVHSSASNTPTPIDPQHLVIIALSGLFAIFTGVLLGSQLYLISINATTVEHLGMERMHERERSVLAKMISRPCSCTKEKPDVGAGDGLPTSRSPVKVLVSRRRIVKQWDAEWGKIETEGNLWWLGSRRANWEATMGRNKLGWILPIGRSLGNGLTYPTNPRFGDEGRWRRRSEWPINLR